VDFGSLVLPMTIGEWLQQTQRPPREIDEEDDGSAVDFGGDDNELDYGDDDDLLGGPDEEDRVFVEEEDGNEVEQGRYLGELSTIRHGVRGSVYALDETTLKVKNFHYDGIGPAAYFYVGERGRPNRRFGLVVPYPSQAITHNGRVMPLRAFNGEDLILPLPRGCVTSRLRWLAVIAYKYNFVIGALKVQENPVPPLPIIPRAEEVDLRQQEDFGVPERVRSGSGVQPPRQRKRSIFSWLG